MVSGKNRFVDEKAELRYKVPADFPKPQHFGAVAGVQDKLLLTEWNGRYYVPGQTPPELYSRWDVCEDLAVKFAKRALESKNTNRAHMSEVEVLAQYLPRLIEKDWTSEQEAKWVMRRAADILGWPWPPNALKED